MENANRLMKRIFKIVFMAFYTMPECKKLDVFQSSIMEII